MADARARLKEALHLYRSGQIDRVEQILHRNTSREMEKSPALGYGISAPALPETPLTPTVGFETSLYHGSDVRPSLPNIPEIIEMPPDVLEPDEISDGTKKEIEKLMIEWLQTDDDRHELSRLKRSLETKRKALSGKLMGFMNTCKIPEIQVDGEHIVKYQVRETKQGYSKELISKLISETFPPDQSAFLLEELERRRKVVEKPILSRKKAK